MWTLRACVVQGSQQIWVAALWYWGYTLNGRPDGYVPPWWIVLILWPLSCMSFVFAYVMLYGLPGISAHQILTRNTNARSRVLSPNTAQSSSLHQDPLSPQTCALVLGFGSSSRLLAQWGMSTIIRNPPAISKRFISSLMDVTGVSCGTFQSPNGRFCCLSLHSLLASGPLCYSYSLISQKPIHGFFQYLRSVSVLPDGVKCVTFYFYYTDF